VARAHACSASGMAVGAASCWETGQGGPGLVRSRRARSWPGGAQDQAGLIKQAETEQGSKRESLQQMKKYGSQKKSLRRHDHQGNQRHFRQREKKSRKIWGGEMMKQLGARSTRLIGPPVLHAARDWLVSPPRTVVLKWQPLHGCSFSRSFG
jgi:hypothetical protein